MGALKYQPRHNVLNRLFTIWLKYSLDIDKVQLNEYETAPNIIQLLKPKLDIGLFVDLAELTCFYHFLHDLIIELIRKSKQNNFMITTCTN